MRQLKAWIAALEWEEAYEKAQYHSVTGSGHWIFEDSYYQQWLDTQFCTDRSLETEERVLSICGKVVLVDPS